jgi:alpha-L-rhamnosidase
MKKLDLKNHISVIYDAVGVIATSLAKAKECNSVKTWLPLLVIISFYVNTEAKTIEFAPVSMRCEYLNNPLGIDVVQPRLSWQLKTETRGQKQSAYRILVASSTENLKLDQGDLWDTGKLQSDQTIQIAYAGKTLRSQMHCFWKVMVWGVDGKASDWSESAHWSMGLLNPDDWKAKWIGFDKMPTSNSNHLIENRLVIHKAMYGAPKNLAKQVDVTEKIRGQAAAGKLDIKVSKELAGRDPAHGVKKVLLIDLSVNGNRKKLKIPEHKTMNLSKGMASVGKEKKYLPSPHLRKEFEVNGKVARSTLYVTAQGFAELHLNGKRVGDEYFTPGWTDYRKRIYYRTYDVTTMLESGSNAMGAILGDGWFRGNISIKGQNQYGKLIRLKAQLQIDYADGRSEVIASDPSWKAAFGPILESDMQAGETFDARKAMPGWDRAAFDVSNWAAVDVGSALKQKPLIQSYPGVPVRKMQEMPTRSISEPQPGKFVFDLGQNFSGWIRLRVKEKSGEKIVMRFGEMLNVDGTVYTENLRSARVTDTYICKGGGEEVWEPHFTFHGFRYVEMTGISAKPNQETVTGIVVSSDASLTSSFQCANPMLNQLHRNIFWGQLSNYLEVPTDCPQRDERLGWTGDTQIFIRSGCYNQDVSAFFTKWNIDLMDTQRRDGAFGHQAPVFHGHGSPGWSDAGVICPWTIYQVYGDVRMVAQHYDQMAYFIERCKLKGLKRPGNSGFGDWLAIGSKTPKDLISQAYFAHSTSLMIDMAEALNKKEDADKFRQLLTAIKSDFQQSFVQDDGTITGHSQTAYCMAICFDLLNEKQRKKAATYLVERIRVNNYHLSVGFLGVNILLPALTEIGRSDLAYRLIQNKTYPSWGYSIEQGATTTWERWNSYTKKDGFGPVKMNSFNHYAYGSCSEWMFRTMLGIDTEVAGYQKLKMKPEFDKSLPWAKGHYDSIHGRIVSDWRWHGSEFEWAVIIPPNTTATIYMPANALSLTESGDPISKAIGVRFRSMENNRKVYELQSGHYFFNADLR